MGSYLITVSGYVRWIFGLFHDMFPFWVDLVEEGGLSRQVLHGEGGFQDWLQVDPVALVEIPLIYQILHIS